MTPQTQPTAITKIDVPLSALHPNTWNPNKMSERTYAAAVESIQTFGFVDPITVRPHPSIEGEYQIIDGFHRWKASVDLRGLDATVPVISLDVDDPAAKKLTVILNETRGEADATLLGTLLADLSTQLDPEELVKGLRYDDSELAHLMSLADVDWDAFTPPAPAEPEPDKDDGWASIAVRIPVEALQVWQAAVDAITKETTLHADPAVANGQAIEILAASYLAR
jgi:ParB/RepB/Spo0J family partition protein